MKKNDIQCKKGFVSMTNENGVVNVDGYSFETGKLTARDNISENDALEFGKKYGCDPAEIKKSYNDLS
jgi:hypothetical protein